MLSSLLPHQNRTQSNEPKNYICFYTDAGTDDITISVASPGWNGSIFYSTDGNNWTTTNWNGSAVTGKKLYFRGLNNTTITAINYASDDKRFAITCNSNVKCDGNIEALRGYNGSVPTMGNACYGSMFANNAKLVKAPQLPATTVSVNAYNAMFYGCTALIAPPALPATTLAEACYLDMFRGCSALVTATSLPATTLANSCYRSMFGNCTSMTTLPYLPATGTFPAYCFAYMFSGCSLVKISTTYDSDVYKYTAYKFTGTFIDTSFLDDMFGFTGGTIRAAPTPDTQYYSANPLV